MTSSILTLDDMIMHIHNKEVWIDQQPPGIIKLTLSEVEKLRNYLSWALEIISQEIMMENLPEENQQ